MIKVTLCVRITGNYYDDRYRTLKWQMRIYLHFLHVAIVNANVLYNYHLEEDAKLSLLSFTRSVVADWCSIDLPPETPDAKVVPHFPSPRCRNKVEWSAAVEARTTGHHFPIRLTTAPYDQRGKCIMCNKKAQFKCRHCGVYLHLSHHNEVGCWDAFHSDLSL